jgi:choline dehydrogenase-like flavoprotein
MVGGPSAEPGHANEVLIRLTAEGAMDPTQANHVRLSLEPGAAGEDAWGIRKADVVCALSERDSSRVAQMVVEMRAAAAALGGTLPDKLEPMPAGRSHHEGGTLRMGTDAAVSVVDPTGRFHRVRNLYAADASVFPNIGVANPMLTITALAYHVAASIERALAAEAGDEERKGVAAHGAPLQMVPRIGETA